MPEFEAVPGWLFYKGQKFACPCGNQDFKVELDVLPHNFWCTCGIVYTEASVNLIKDADGE